MNPSQLESPVIIVNAPARLLVDRSNPVEESHHRNTGIRHYLS